MHRQRPHAIPLPTGQDLTGGTAEDILLVLDSIVAEGQGLAPDEVRALRDALAEAIDATIPDDGDPEPWEHDQPFGQRDVDSEAGLYLDVEGLAQVWTGLGHLVGTGEA